MPHAFQLTEDVSPLVMMIDVDKAFVQSPGLHEALKHGLINQFSTDYSTTLSIRSRTSVLNRIREVAEERLDDARRGYPTGLVHTLTQLWSRSFLLRLPAWLDDPEVGVDPNGDLTFEWYAGPDHILSISLAPTGSVVYAYANGLRRENGCDDIAQDIPGNLIELLRSFKKVAEHA